MRKYELVGICFDRDRDAYIKELRIKTDNGEVIIKSDIPARKKLDLFFDYEQSIFKVSDDGHLMFNKTADIHEHQTVIYNGEELSRHDAAEFIDELLNEQPAEMVQQIFETTDEYCDILTEDLAETFERVKNRAEYLLCLKLDEEGNYLITSEAILKHQKYCPKYLDIISGVYKNICGKDHVTYEEAVKGISEMVECTTSNVEVGDIVSYNVQNTVFKNKVKKEKAEA